MKKTWSFLIALMLALCFVVPAQAAYQDMWANVYKDTGKIGSDGRAILTRITSGIRFVVFQQNSTSKETLYVYGDNAYTSLSNPVEKAYFESASYCNDRVAFRVDPTDTTYDRYVDVLVLDTSGNFCAFVEDFDKYTHTIIIDERPNVVHHGAYYFGAIGTSNSEFYTGASFVADSIIHDVQLEVITASTATMNVGIWGTSNGFLAGISMAVAGYVPDPAFTTTANGASTKYGAFLAQTQATSGAQQVVRSGHIVTGSTEGAISYSINSTTNYPGFIHYRFTRMK